MLYDNYVVLNATKTVASLWLYWCKFIFSFLLAYYVDNNKKTKKHRYFHVTVTSYINNLSYLNNN